MAYDETALRNVCELGALATATAGVVVLGLACAAELLRRARRGAGLVALADRLLPTPSRRLAVAVMTVLSAVTAFVLPASARADDDLRGWLTDATTTTSAPARTPVAPPTAAPRVTTTSAPPSTEAPPADAQAPAPAAPRPGLVLRPAPAPAPTVPATAPAPPVAVPPMPPIAGPPIAAPASSSPSSATHTVVAGECLWSIAVGVLGRGASARAVDRGWRAIYATNHPAIGPDPNLIHPGLVLSLPPLDPNP